jgi:hypothetical protein
VIQLTQCALVKRQEVQGTYQEHRGGCASRREFTVSRSIWDRPQLEEPHQASPCTACCHVLSNTRDSNLGLQKALEPFSASLIGYEVLLGLQQTQVRVPSVTCCNPPFVDGPSPVLGPRTTSGTPITDALRCISLDSRKQSLHTQTSFPLGEMLCPEPCDSATQTP